MRVKERLQKMGKTQKELAEHLGVSQPYMNLLLNDKREWPMSLAIKATVFLRRGLDHLFLS